MPEMTALLKLIEDFPRGRSTRELQYLLGIDRHPRRKAAFQSELTDLLREGLIERDPNRKWRARSRRPAPAVVPQPGNGPENHALFEPLIAAPVRLSQIQREQIAEIEDAPDENANVAGPDPSSLLRYYKAALRSDPRGALEQAPDRHGTAFQIVTGSGSWWSDETRDGEIRARLDQLPDSFREALTMREAEDQALAIGWPIAIGRRHAAPSIVPVGLFAASWKRCGDELVVSIEADDVMVNPKWSRLAARATGWTRAKLDEVFQSSGAVGLPRDDFRARLKEAAARSASGPLHGTQPVAVLEPDAEGIYDALGLFLPTETSFTKGAVNDLDRLSNWSASRLAQTALAPFLGLSEASRNVTSEPAAGLNTGPLNAEQIQSVLSSTQSPVTVVTGPPGTGKSQAIVAMAASALAAGQSVLVASKNHQALDAVEERLGGIATQTPFMVRTLNPAKDLDRDIRSVLDELVGGTNRHPGLPPDEAITYELHGLAAQRRDALEMIETSRRLNCDLAEYLERRDAVVTARRNLGERVQERSAPPEPSRRGFLRRLLDWLLRRGRRAEGEKPESSRPIGMSLAEIDREIARLREGLSAQPKPRDPAKLTDRIAELVPNWLARVLAHRCTVSAEVAADLDSAGADLALHGEGVLDRALTESVVHHRPLWLASVLGTPRRIGLHDGLFDLVIFDEASQCDIGSALPLLARARRAVVVGDAKQLAFISQIGASQDRNLMAAQGLPIKGMGRFAQGTRSLFSLAARASGAIKIILRDQYRSAEDIVSYINSEFYRGELRVSGALDTLKPPRGMRPGLAWTDVPGCRHERGGNVNPAEVEAIAAHLRKLLVEQGYKGSVGVIAPFRDQVKALSAALEVALPETLRNKADLRVGTVDAYQGQERDLILFSPVLHGGSASTATTFLTRDARRLNVAISRARAVAHVFGDKSFARSGKVRPLARLLSRIENPRAPSGEGVFDSHWERVVDAELRRRGLNYDPQHPVAGRRLDFAVFGAEGIKLDLEVDGRLFHQDTDGNRKLDDHWRDHQLRSLGWKVRRFWVDKLKQDLEGCIDRVEQDLVV